MFHSFLLSFPVLLQWTRFEMFSSPTDTIQYKDFQSDNHWSLFWNYLKCLIFDFSNLIFPKMILDNLHSGNIQKHVLLFGVEKYSPSQYLFIDINSLTLSMISEA